MEMTNQCVGGKEAILAMLLATSALEYRTCK